MKLVIAICSARDWKPQFGSALAGLIAYVCTKKIKGVTLEEFDLRVFSNVSNVSNGRQFALDQAIERGFTHILFLDDDMTFQPDLLDHLCRHKADLVTVNYSHKHKQTNGMLLGKDGMYLRKRDGSCEVLRGGFGAMLVDLKIPATLKKPHFAMPWSEHHQKTIGEDYFFCDRVVKAGGKMIADLDVKVGHVGDYEYMLDDPSFREFNAAKDSKPETGA